MRHLRVVLAVWLCGALSIMSVLAAVLPILEAQHQREHAPIAHSLGGVGETHDAEDHSHDDIAIDLLSHLDLLLGAAGALVGAMAAAKSSSVAVLSPSHDPSLITAPAPTGTADPPDRPPRRLV